MKIKSMLIILGLVSILSGCVGVIERPVMEPRPVAIVEPVPMYEVVIVNGIPVRRVVVSHHPVVIHRHH